MGLTKNNNHGEDKENYEKLFLFEFLVDNVRVYNSRLSIDKTTLSLLGPMAVRFQFFNYPPIEVCEESFAPSTKPLMEEKSVPMKSGKSCMFSLKSDKALSQTSLNVYLTVYQYKLQKYCKPGQTPGKLEVMFIGRTKMSMTDVFQELFTQCLDSTGRLTRSKTACNKLVDNQGTEVGKITFMIRVSCFGFMVMTGFQLPEEEQKDFKYKHIEYDPLGESLVEQEMALIGDQPAITDACPPCSETINKQNKRMKGKVKGKDKDDKCKDGQDDKGKKKVKAKPVDIGTEPAPCPFGFPPCPCLCQSKSCSPKPLANGGTVHSVRAGSITSSPQPAGAPNRARNMDIDPGSVGIRGNQLVFKMPDIQAGPQVGLEGKFASSVYYKMDNENQNGARNVIQILPKNPNLEVDKAKVDDKQDVLVLKLGKKRMAAGKSPKLELELRTPKMKEERPLTDVKDTQYLLSDLPKPAKKGKGGSQKGGKSGKGKGKGKKK